VLGELQRGCDVVEDRWVVAIDSTVDCTVVRAHQHAAGARHQPPSDVPAAVLATALAEDLGSAVGSAVGSAQGAGSAVATGTGGTVE
jgi:hypothetical protein